MSYIYAGRFFEAVFDSNSQLIKGVAFSVFTDSGLTTHATLYTDASMGTVITGNVASDSYGNLQIFAAPGTYFIRNNSDNFVQSIQIFPDNRDFANVAQVAGDSDLATIAALDSTQSGVIASDGSGWFRKTYSALKAALSLNNVDNTSDTSKPVSTLMQAALDLKQPLDADLTAIANLIAADDDFIQHKAGAWTNRTVAQVKTDLGLTAVTGQYLGSSTTFVGLPTVDAIGGAASNGDWAVLNTDVVGTGTTQNPQYPRGIYIYNGSVFSLALSISADGALLSTNNLSDVQSAATTRSNLSLDQVTNTSDVNKPVSTAQATAIGLPFVCNLVAQYGADPTGAVESVTALQNAINDAVKSGATFADIYIPKGTYKFDKVGTPFGVNWNGGNAGTLRIRGDGMGATKFTAGANTKQFIKATGTTSNSYNNLMLWGITWDQAFQAPPGWGNPGGLLNINTNANVDNIWVEYCEVRNHTVQPAGQPFSVCIDIETYLFVGSNTPAYTTSNIHVTDCKFGAVGPGGNYQVKIMGFSDYTGAPQGWNTVSGNYTIPHTINEIYVERNYCRVYTTPPISFVSCSNIIIGNNAHGGKCVIRDNQCFNSGDDGIEVDSMLDTIIENNYLQDSFTSNAGIFLVNLGGMPTPELQTIRLSGNQYHATTAKSGVAFMETGTAPFGHITLENERHFDSTSALVSGDFRSLTIRNMKGIGTKNITVTANNTFISNNLLFVDQMGGRAPITIDGFHDEVKLTIDNSGAFGNCQYNPQPIYMDALTDAKVTVKNVTQRYDVKTIGGVSFKPFTIGALNQIPNASVIDNFAADNLVSYYFFTGTPGTDAIVTGGVLTPGSSNLTTERRAHLMTIPNLVAYHLACTGPFTDGGMSKKCIPGSVITGYKDGTSVKGSLDGTNRINGYVVDDGTNSYLCLDKVVAGTRTSLLGAIVGGAGTVTAITGVTGASDRGIQLASRITTSVPFWVLTKVRGNTATCDYFTSALTNATSVGATTATAVLSGAADIAMFGNSAQGWGGFDWIPQAADAANDDLVYWRMNVFSAEFEDVSIWSKYPLTLSQGFLINNQAGTTRLRGDGISFTRVDAGKLQGLATTYLPDINVIDSTLAPSVKVRYLTSANPTTSGTITAPGSGVAWTNNLGFSVRAKWVGGALTTPFVEVSNDGGANWRAVWAAAGDANVFLNAWDQVRWTYSSTPTFTWTSAADQNSNAVTPGSPLQGTTFSVVTKGVDYILTNSDDLVEFTVAGKVLTFHDATTATKKSYRIVNSSGGSITFATTSAQTVNGSTTGTIINGQTLDAVPDGSKWVLV